MTARPALPMTRYALTDVGNGERLIATHGRDLRWVPRWKTWIVWDGRRWARDETHEVERRAKSVVRDMFRDADHLPDDEAKKLIGHAHRSESSPRLKAMVDLARSEPGVSIGYDALDQQAMLLTVRNGTIDLTTGQLLPHQRGHLITKLVDIDYDPDAKCPVWQETLNTLFGGDAQVVNYVQRAVGYSLTGDTREQVLHLCHGSGSNGKSTILDVLGQLSGEYGRQADFSSFLDLRNRAGNAPSGDIARLAGARLVRSSEVGENKRLNEELIKHLTGGEVVSARFLFSEDFEYKPQFKLWLAANHKPTIRGADYGIWRRVRLIPFEVTITPEQRDHELPNKLRGELSGILTWAVEGCQEWLERGLFAPDRVLAATSEYRSESDIIATFISDECEVELSCEVQSADLYKAYARWAKDNGEYVMTNTMFGRRLQERGFLVVKRGGVKYRRGLTLQSDSTGRNTSNFWEDRSA